MLKYASIGIRDEDLRLVSSNDPMAILRNISKLTSKNLDYRDKPVNGYPEINFQKYKTRR